jgi:hypothetical protein
LGPTGKSLYTAVKQAVFRFTVSAHDSHYSYSSLLLLFLFAAYMTAPTRTMAPITARIIIPGVASAPPPFWATLDWELADLTSYLVVSEGESACPLMMNPGCGDDEAREPKEELLASSPEDGQVAIKNEVIVTMVTTSRFTCLFTHRLVESCPKNGEKSE